MPKVRNRSQAGWEGVGCPYKRAAGEMLVVLELFSILTVVV